MKRKFLSIILCFVFMLSFITGMEAEAVSTSAYLPNANIEYGYTSSVTCGTIRYISQVSSGSHFYSDYWPASAFGGYYGASSECGTACISMALSYVGVNKTPKDILTANNGYTVFGNWGNASHSSPALSTAISNYINGAGKYSPVVIHLPNYSSDGHYVVIIGKISSGSYQILDPWECSVTTMTINGTAATYSKSGKTITDTINEVHQWYNSSASIPSASGTAPVLTVGVGSEFDSSVLLSWTKAANYEAGYWIKRSTDKNGPWTCVKERWGGDSTIWVDTTVEPGTTYYYKVQPYNENGNGGSHSNIVEWTTLAKLVVEPATSYDSSLRLTWTKTQNYNAGYWVKRSTSSSGPWTCVKERWGGDNTTWVDTTVEPGKTYYYKIQPYNEQGYGGPHSNIVQYTAPNILISSGWMKNNIGYWYRYSDGSYPADQWALINGRWYHFDSNGYMQSGWQLIGGKWYYLGAANDGSMKTGWQLIGGTWYYFSGSGAMVTGWQAISGTWYYFSGSGAMVTGWQAISGKWYYFSVSGAMQTGWLKSGGKWYYLSSSGAMVTNTWIGNCYLDSNGVWTKSR